MVRLCLNCVRPKRTLRVRCGVDPQPTRRPRQAPEIQTPRAPPPPPVPPPPPPEVEDEPKLFGINRRTLFPFLVGVPVGLVWRNYLQSEKIQEEVVASVLIPRKTKEGTIRKTRKDVKFVTGKNGMLYVVGKDKRGRTYMVDANGVLFYDSGIESVGWYAVDLDGEMLNLYPENGEVKVKSVGNISEMKPYQFDEFMGLPIEARRWVAFEDKNLKPLAPNVPLVKSTKDDSWLPPFFIDEGEIVLEEKETLNPFDRANGGGKFKLD